MIKYIDYLRLEVEAPVTGLPNLVPNPSGDLGAWGWVTPVANTLMTTVTPPALKFQTTVSQAAYLTTEFLPVAASKFVGARFDLAAITTGHNVKARFEFYTSAKVLISSSTQTAALSTLGTQYVPAVQAPATTAYVKLRLDFYNGTANPTAGASVTFNQAMVTWANATFASPYAFTESNAWTDILAPSHEITIERGALDVGLLVAEVLDPHLDPAVASSIAVGKKVRLRALVDGAYQSVFTGTLTNALVKYPPEGTRVQITAADNIKTLTNQGESRGVTTIAELPYLLEGKGVPWNVNGSGAQVGSALVLATNENASVLDQIAVTRDTVQGFAWVDRNNVLCAFDAANVASTANAVPNGDFEVGASGWTAMAGTTFARTTAQAQSGTASVSVSNSAGGTAGITTPTGTAGIPVMGGQPLTITAYSRAATTVRSVKVTVNYYDKDGVQVIGGGSTTTTDSTTAWTKHTFTDTPPADAVYLTIKLQADGTAAGEVHYWDSVSVATPAVVYSDVPISASIYDSYSEIDASFNTDDVINVVNVTLIWDNYLGETNEDTYGPYSDPASVATYGPFAADYTVYLPSGGNWATFPQQVANAVLAANATPVRKANSITVPVKDPKGVKHATLVDLYSQVGVAYKTKVNATYRVTAIKHTITPDLWTVEYGFASTGSVASPQITPSTGSAGGSGDWHIIGAAGEPPFENGWSCPNTDLQPRFRQNADGTCTLSGIVAGGTARTIFTLPVGSRPSSVIPVNAMRGLDANTRIDIGTGGDVGLVSTTRTGNIAFYITFPTK